MADNITLPKGSKDLTGIRSFLDNIRSQACSLASTYEGPVKALLAELTSKLETTLALLPKDSDGNWDVASVLDCLFGCLANANAVASSLGLEVSKLKGTMASAVTTEIDRKIIAGELFTAAKHTELLSSGLAAAIKAKVDAGELVPKELSSQLCSQAKLQGIEEGKTTITAEFQRKADAAALAATRKAGLTTAGFPLPDAEVEKVLTLPEAEYAAAKALVETRREELKTLGVTLAAPELLARLWGSDTEWKTVKAIILAIPSLKGTPEPLAGGMGSPAAGLNIIV